GAQNAIQREKPSLVRIPPEISSASVEDFGPEAAIRNLGRFSHGKPTLVFWEHWAAPAFEEFQGAGVEAYRRNRRLHGVAK
ncbi:MAG: hypothetical protein OXU65_01960, partial [Deltaproteobacteria bacterium]|nr:hypothetical protein [Deltaproteobacteria bacterium]